VDARLKKDNKGITLAELIVTFALMGIFLSAVAMVISSSVVLHSELTDAMYAMSVGETLLDKVTGELAYAMPEGNQAMTLGENTVSFCDREGRQADFSVEDGLLVMETPVSWKMDAKAYMGYRITGMQVQRLNEENVLEVTIQLKNLKTGYEYTASRTVKSFNFKTEQDFQKIMELK
jgi:Tfp pilus assembly protein PilE